MSMRTEGRGKHRSLREIGVVTTARVEITVKLGKETNSEMRLNRLGADRSPEHWIAGNGMLFFSPLCKSSHRRILDKEFYNPVGMFCI